MTDSEKWGCGTFLLFVAGCFAIPAWLTPKTNWQNEAPKEVIGQWRIVGARNSDGPGKYELVITPKSIKFNFIDSAGEKDSLAYPIAKASITGNNPDESGKVILFYGKLNKSQITDDRLLIYYGTKKRIEAYELFGVSDVQDEQLFLGEFVLIAPRAIAP